MSEYREYCDENSKAMLSVEEAQITQLVTELRSLRNRDSTLWVAGNGGSAASASHAVADLSKTAKALAPSRAPSLRLFALHESASLATAYANDDGFDVALANQLEGVGRSGDALLLVSVSGNSPNLVAAADRAHSLGMKVFSLVGGKPCKLSNISDLCIPIMSTDYQIVENCHMALIHWVTKILG